MSGERQIVESLIGRLREANALLCCVESCTGGLIAHRITNVPGSSDILWGSIVSYQNSAKNRLLGIDAKLLEDPGAVSEIVARLMAEAGLAQMKAAAGSQASKLISISTSGLTGPGGGSSQTPVGTCFFGLAVSGSPTQTDLLKLPSSLDRLTLKDLFVKHALEWVMRSLP